MTKQTTIPAGYRITVVTWENDADNYRTEVKEGISKEEVQFYVDLLKPFQHSYHQADGCLGNIYSLTVRQGEQLQEHYKAIFEKYPNIVSVDTDEEASLEDCLSDIFGDYLYDLSVRGGDQDTRVVESIKVEYTPQAITFDDVTGEFWK